MRPVAIMKMGSTLPAIAAEHGDFEDWIRSGLELAAGEVSVVDVVAGDPLPAPGDISGAVITGSAAMVSEREAWSERTAAWIPTLLEAGTPLLGICYGHQLIAHGVGGRVQNNPLGREIGTIEVTLNGEARRDPLFRAMPEKLTVHASHVESVVELPPGARHFGSSPGDPNHAFAVGERAWGVQFHPEFDAGIVRGYIDGRREILQDEGLVPEALAAAVRDSDHGPRLLRRFAEIVRDA
jgi:GMP synthase (glutamine-hydrolysing)